MKWNCDDQSKQNCSGKIREVVRHIDTQSEFVCRGASRLRHITNPDSFIPILHVLCILSLLAVSTGCHSEAKPGEELRLKAEQGDVQAQVHLGIMYVEGQEVSKNEVAAAVWFRRAAGQGDALAQYNLGVMYELGKGVTKDEDQAVKWYQSAAEQGDPLAQRCLGMMYGRRTPTAQNASEAIKWLRKAAQNDDVVAQSYLGFKYATGRGVLKDEAEAAKWHRKAAEKGSVDSQWYLGSMCELGQGIRKDEIEAANWYRKAADQGHGMAQLFLASMYEKGQVVPKDEAEAVRLYRESAAHGNAEAQIKLGVRYAFGRGVPKNEVEAVRWYRKAADQGAAEAQLLLSTACLLGQGIVEDKVEAYKWMLLAAAQGDESAKGGIPLCEAVLTPTERAEGQKMAREFKPLKISTANTASSLESIAQFRSASTGSGFFITSDGYAITNNHVAENGTTVRVLTSSGAIPAKIIKVDKVNDIALLKAEGNFAAISVVSSRGVRLGSTVATVGFPNVGLQGFMPKLAKGEIASLAGAQDDARHFQISVPVQPGNSGGALVDDRGNVIGVIVAKLSQKAALATSGALAENVNYAVKSSYLLSFLESVPEVSAKLKEPIKADRKFEEVVKDVEQASVLVLVY